MADSYHPTSDWPRRWLNEHRSPKTVSYTYPQCALYYDQDIHLQEDVTLPSDISKYGIDRRLLYAMRRCRILAQGEHILHSYRISQLGTIEEVMEQLNSFDAGDPEWAGTMLVGVGQRGDSEIIDAVIEVMKCKGRISPFDYNDNTYFHEGHLGHIFQGIGYGGHTKLYIQLIQQYPSLDHLEATLHFACINNQRKLIDLIMGGLRDEEAQHCGALDNEFLSMRTTAAYIGLCGAVYAGNLKLVKELVSYVDWENFSYVCNLDDPRIEQEALFSGDFDTIRYVLLDLSGTAQDDVRNYMPHLTSSPFSTVECFEYVYTLGYGEDEPFNVKERFREVVEAGNVKLIRYILRKLGPEVDLKSFMSDSGIDPDTILQILDICEPLVKCAPSKVK